MKRAAFFVEGQTEQEFMLRLFREVGGAKGLQVETRRAIGGRSSPRRMQHIALHGDSGGPSHYVLLVDCGGDSRVVSDIREEYDSLCNKGFTHIVGVRDVYPKTLAEVPKLERGMRFGLKTRPVSPEIILAVLELEAWFIAEYLHFQALSPTLTPGAVSEIIGINVEVDDPRFLPHPAASLREAYRSVGISYDKHQAQINRTCDALDYAHLYMGVAARVPELAALCRILDDFLRPAA